MWKSNLRLFTLFMNVAVLLQGFGGHTVDGNLAEESRFVPGEQTSDSGLSRPRIIGVDTNDCNFTHTDIVDYNNPRHYNCITQDTDSQAVRIEVQSSDAKVEMPILFVVKQQKSVLSWAVPHIIENKYTYSIVSHTLCPELSNSTSPKNISISVTTSSTKPVKFTLNATQVPNFKLKLNKKISVPVTPSQSQYYKFKFPDSVKSVIVKATSDSKLCSVVSLQDISCPVYDQFRNVEFTGFYQTMTTKAALTVERDYFKTAEFFVVLVVQPDDGECGDRSTNEGSVRNKTIEIIVEETYASTEYWRPVFATVGIMLLFYLVTGILVFIASTRHRDVEFNSCEEPADQKVPDPSTNHPFVQAQHEGYGSTGPSPNHVGHGGTGGDGRGGSVSDEDDIDYLDDIEHEKEVYRTKTVLFVSDLSRKDPKLMRMKYRLYHWNLITIAVFYALPVIQLVVTYETVLNITGDEDICYYNFLCANPAGVISAFNNVFSNIGYMMLGILFLLLVYRREYLYKKELAMGNRRSERCGIPKLFGLYYALGIALFMEGVLSACYHVCPNYSNFQFDTSFMYIIAGLGMLKLYQQRHPDINANAYASYACFAGVIFIAVLGVVLNSLWFYLVYAIVHFLMCVVLSAQIYYMGQWKLDFGIFKRIWYVVRTDCLRCSKPVYTDRMVVLLIGNAVNWSLAIFGLAKQPKDFASFLLAIFIVNLLLYLMFYIIMKIRCKERILPVAIVFLVCTIIIWIMALYFFSLGLTQWQKTPAQSREGNEECILMGFYDGHDVWHFLTAAAMFFSFMLLLVLDDDLDNKPRTEIQVF